MAGSASRAHERAPTKQRKIIVKEIRNPEKNTLWICVYTEIILEESNTAKLLENCTQKPKNGSEIALKMHWNCPGAVSMVKCCSGTKVLQSCSEIARKLHSETEKKALILHWNCTGTALVQSDWCSVAPKRKWYKTAMKLLENCTQKPKNGSEIALELHQCLKVL